MPSTSIQEASSPGLDFRGKPFNEVDTWADLNHNVKTDGEAQVSFEIG